MVRAAALLVGIGTFCCACVPDYPGEPVGTFEVTGALQDNTCGSQAVAARDPLTFRVEIRREGAQAYWRRPSAPLVDGSVDTEGMYRFRSRSRVTILEPDPAAQEPGCVVEQIEQVEVRITAENDDAGVSDAGSTDTGVSDAGSTDAGVSDAGSADAGVSASMFEGTQVIELVPVDGSDCSEALATGGGPFATLPCRLDYDLTATSTAPF